MNVGVEIRRRFRCPDDVLEDDFSDAKGGGCRRIEE